MYRWDGYEIPYICIPFEKEHYVNMELYVSTKFIDKENKTNNSRSREHKTAKLVSQFGATTPTSEGF